jgi:transposase
MATNKRTHSAEFKFRVALEALGEWKTVSQIASEYDVHPTLVRQWKKRLQEGGADIFANPANQKQQEAEQVATEAALYEQIMAQKADLQVLEIQPEPVHKLPAPKTITRFVFTSDVIDETQGLKLIDEQGAWKSNGFQALLWIPCCKKSLIACSIRALGVIL